MYEVERVILNGSTVVEHIYFELTRIKLYSLSTQFDLRQTAWLHQGVPDQSGGLL